MLEKSNIYIKEQRKSALDKVADLLWRQCDVYCAIIVSILIVELINIVFIISMWQ